MSKKLVALVAVLAVGLAAVLPALTGTMGKAEAAAASLYFARGSATSGSDLYVEVRTNTGLAVNAVQADFTYPTSRLTFVGVDSTNSGFEVTASQTGGSGSVSIARGTTTPKTGDVLVATVHFTVSGAAGIANLGFQNSSVLLNGGSNVPVQYNDAKFFGINGPLKTIYRLWNSVNNDRLLTADDNERSVLTANVRGWRYEANAFSVAPTADSGAIPIYRLWNSINNDRLLTTDQNEKNVLVATVAGWRYEGVAFYAVPASAAGAVPVYRLWNSINNDRLLTIDLNERNVLSASYPGWKAEGTAFYVAP